MKFSAITFLAITFLFCSSKEHQNSDGNLINPVKNAKKKSVLIKSSKKEIICNGFVVYNEKFGNNPVFNIYKENKQSYATFNFTNLSKEVKPYAWSPDNFLLVFRCLKKVKDRYQVIINEDTKAVGYIIAKDFTFKYQTTEEHILSVFSVGFDNTDNPIKKSPTNSSEILTYDNDEFYHPVSVKDEWLKIKWGDEGNWKYGWIKWKAKNEMIIELFYFA
jgi:hypothetical protein